MLREILYTTALDENGNILLVDNAEKGTMYYCPICKNEFTLTLHISDIKRPYAGSEDSQESRDGRPHSRSSSDKAVLEVVSDGPRAVSGVAGL